MNCSKTSEHIVSWLSEYCMKGKFSGFVIGVSGGVDSALTSILCARTKKRVLLINMPIRQTTAEYERANNHIADLKRRFNNVESLEVDLSDAFSSLEVALPTAVLDNFLAMANSRSRLRMLTLYAVAQANNCLVTGTGNKVEDFGIGFFTKYGDGGVDISPIADLTKTHVWTLARHLEVIESIVLAKPTDGLWEDGRSDEDQIGASYPELEWAMQFQGEERGLTERQREVLAIYRKFNSANSHKMQPIPVCIVPKAMLV
jgi:NAD+ synthase